MFTWICPTCGKEVPPSMDECPRCKPAAPVVQPVPAQAPAPAPVPAMAPQPQQAFAAPQQPPQPQYAPQPPQGYAPQPQPYAPNRYDPPPPASTGMRDLLVTLGVAGGPVGRGYLVGPRSGQTSGQAKGSP